MMLFIRRLDGESWRDCCARYGRQHGLEGEVLDAYERAIASGSTEEQAAFDACYEWDCTDLDGAMCGK